jgi:hypothetical protein
MVEVVRLAIIYLMRTPGRHGFHGAGFENRIMFGSDEMVWPDAVSAAIDTIQDDPALTSGQKRDILYNNAARFLRIER